MSRAVPTSPFARYPRLYTWVEGMTEEEARMVVKAIVRMMPAVLKDGYKGYRSAGTRADEAIQCNDWNNVYKTTERYLGGERGWYDAYDLATSDSEDEDSDFEEESGEENKFKEKFGSEEEADDEAESEEEYEYEYESEYNDENGYEDYTHCYYYDGDDDDGETIQTIVNIVEPQLKKEHPW